MKSNPPENKPTNDAVAVTLEDLALELVRGGGDGAPTEEAPKRCHCGSMCKGK